MNDEQWQVITGDCLEVMRGMDAGSVDAVITDPPYGLSFMGKEWDHGVPGVHFWQEALRVAKPGAMMLAFGGTRTFHRLAVAIEDAGWELRDTIMWVYGSGFPKSHDISKAIHAKETLGGSSPEMKRRAAMGDEYTSSNTYAPGERRATQGRTTAYSYAINEPTDAARQWHGWGTALKPAWEPIILAMKPLDGTFAANALRHGVAGLNIDGSRVGTEGGGTACNNRDGNGNCKGHPTANGSLGGGVMRHGPQGAVSGRWPANVLHDGSAEVLAGFPVTGLSSGGRAGHTAAYQGGFKQEYYGDTKPGYGDTGSAARFFYCAKSSRAERNAGLEGMPEVACGMMEDDNYPIKTGSGKLRETKRQNHHPTVKPLALMRHLARLTKTPTGGVVLDPFAGSGSTGCAAVMEGRGFIGIEIDEDYADIARARIAKAAEQARQLTLGIEQAA